MDGQQMTLVSAPQKSVIARASPTLKQAAEKLPNLWATVEERPFRAA
jgi:hypothetical protein